MSSRALPLFALAYFCQFASVGLQAAFASPALLALGFGGGAIGFMWGLRSALGVVAPTLWGALADQRGDGRPFCALTLVGGGLALFGLAFVEGEPLGYLAFALYGLFGAATASLLDGLVLAALGDEQRRYGDVRLWGAIGFGVAAFAGSQAVERGLLAVEAEQIFPLAGLLHAVGALAVLASPKVRRAPAARFSALMSAARSSGIGWLGLVAVLHWGGHGAYHAFITPLAEQQGLGPADVGLALSWAICCEVAAMRASGRLIARFGAERLLFGSLVLTVLRWTLLALTSGSASFILLHGLHGVSFGLFYTTAVTLVARRTPDSVRQGAQGLFSSLLFGVGGALGSIIAGALVALERPGLTWGAMALLAALALVVAWVALIRERRRARRDLP